MGRLPSRLARLDVVFVDPTSESINDLDQRAFDTLFPAVDKIGGIAGHHSSNTGALLDQRLRVVLWCGGCCDRRGERIDPVGGTGAAGRSARSLKSRKRRKRCSATQCRTRTQPTPVKLPAGNPPVRWTP